jgi:tRNA threonylcarbamoyladenosine biosynthesis protein TsaB
VILAIDTATRVVSLALTNEQSVLAEATWHTANNHTIELAPAIERLLGNAGVLAAQLTAIAVAIGPGSFTGVRIGLGLAKGLAFANNQPLIGVRTLDIVAKGVPLFAGGLIAVIQAGRGRVIWTRYTTSPNGWESADSGTLADWKQVIAQASEGDYVIGEVDPVGIEHLRQRQIAFGTPAQNVRRAAWLAEIGWARWKQGVTDETAMLTPIYAHRPGSGTV